MGGTLRHDRIDRKQIATPVGWARLLLLIMMSLLKGPPICHRCMVLAVRSSKLFALPISFKAPSGPSVAPPRFVYSSLSLSLGVAVVATAAALLLLLPLEVLIVCFC